MGKLGCLEHEWIRAFLNFPEEANCKGINFFLCTHICFGAKWKGEIRKKNDKLFGKYCPSQDRPNHMGGRDSIRIFFPLNSSPAALPFTPLGGLCESDLQDHPFKAGNISSTSVHSYSLLKQNGKGSPPNLWWEKQEGAECSPCCLPTSPTAQHR